MKQTQRILFDMFYKPQKYLYSFKDVYYFIT